MLLPKVISSLFPPINSVHKPATPDDEILLRGTRVAVDSFPGVPSSKGAGNPFF
jgi:hypothetical protein